MQKFLDVFRIPRPRTHSTEAAPSGVAGSAAQHAVAAHSDDVSSENDQGTSLRSWVVANVINVAVAAMLVQFVKTTIDVPDASAMTAIAAPLVLGTHATATATEPKSQTSGSKTRPRSKSVTVQQD